MARALAHDRDAPKPDGHALQAGVDHLIRHAFRDDAIQAVRPELEALASEFSEDRVTRILPELEELRRIMDRRSDRR